MANPQYNLIRTDGTRIPIPPNGLRLGRRGDNDVVINGSNISRHHARILVAAGKCWIRDENSALGTLVNGQRVPGQMEFKPGDTLHLGAEAFYLEQQVAGASSIRTPATSSRQSNSGLAIGLGIGLVAILLVAAFASGLFGEGSGMFGGTSYTRYQSPGGGYSIEMPSDWVIEEDFDFDEYATLMHDPDWVDEDRGVIILSAPLEGAEVLFGSGIISPQDMLEFLVITGDLLGVEEMFSNTETQSRTIGGNPAATLETSIEEDGIQYHINIACVLSEENFALFIAALPESDWSDNRSVMDHMLSSLRLQ